MRRFIETGVTGAALTLGLLAASFGVPIAFAGIAGVPVPPVAQAPVSASGPSPNAQKPPHAGQPAPEIPDGAANVVVRADQQNARVAWLEFDSALLGLRAVNRVLLPEVYDEAAPAFGVLYQLHGTRGNTSLGDTLVDAIGLADAAEDAVTEDFLVVSPDAGAKGWCNSCWWVDGRDGQGVMAESHLHEELIPVVEAVFNVRRDRGGRAITGSSMGGIGALIQAFRHPDRFAYVASQSGPASIAEHNDGVQLVMQDQTTFWAYLVGQGYPDPVTRPIAYRNIDVVTLAPQVIGTGLEIVLYANDGCLPPYDESPQPVGDPNCISTGRFDPLDGFQMYNEYTIRATNEAFADRLIDLGVPFRLETDHGRHGISTLYRNHIIPDLNRVFASKVKDPDLFSYKTSDRAFSVWEYDFNVLDRPNEEFLHVMGAATDGSAFTLAGTGSVQVHTPRVAQPGTTLDVVIIRENSPRESRALTADDRGRIVLALDLGETRSVDQRRAISRQGLMAFPRTRIEIPVTERKPVERP